MGEGKKPDLVIMGLNLSGSKEIEDVIRQMKGEEMDGVEATQKIIDIDPDANIIGFTAFADLEWGKKLVLSLNIPHNLYTTISILLL